MIHNEWRVLAQARDRRMRASGFIVRGAQGTRALAIAGSVFYVQCAQIVFLNFPRQFG